MLGLTWWRQTVRAWKGRKMSDIHPGYKRCNGCQDVKRLMDFHKRQASKDGRMPRCKVCRAIEQKKYRMRPENPELFREKCRQWRLDHPDHARDYKRRRKANPGQTRLEAQAVEQQAQHRREQQREYDRQRYLEEESRKSQLEPTAAHVTARAVLFCPSTC
jgi:hypothetical protein